MIFPVDVLPVHPTPLAEDLKGNGILDHAKDAVFKLVEKAAKVLTGSKSDTDVYTDNMTGATEEVVIEGLVFLVLNIFETENCLFFFFSLLIHFLLEMHIHIPFYLQQQHQE